MSLLLAVQILASTPAKTGIDWPATVNVACDDDNRVAEIIIRNLVALPADADAREHQPQPQPMDIPADIRRVAALTAQTEHGINKVVVVKYLRAQYGLKLRESKFLVDNVLAEG